jgi:hypothetical protein
VNLEEISHSLAPIRQSLEESGFNLDVDQPESGMVMVTVRPGPDACHECLVPKPTFKRMLLDSIGPGLEAPSTLTVRYPVDLV